MKRLGLVLGLALGCAATAGAQCSPTAPCVGLSASDTTMAAAVALSAAGAETAGPGYVTIYKYTGATAPAVGSSSWTVLSGGASSGCPLDAAGASTAGVSCTMAQTSAAIAFTDGQGIVFGQTDFYYMTVTWTGTQGGAPSAPSAIFQLAIAAPSGLPPETPAGPAAKAVTSGAPTN